MPHREKEGVMAACGIGKVIAWRRGKFGINENSVQVSVSRLAPNRGTGKPEWVSQQKSCSCPNGDKPLAVWVSLRVPVRAASYTVPDICEACYRGLYEEAPLPDASGGPMDRGYFVRAASSNQELAAPPVAPVIASAPVAPPSVLKPQLKRQNAMFIIPPRRT
jgi:hypothetical protein